MNPALPDPLDTVFTAASLENQHFPPLEYVVPGLIPEGLTLLVGGPKLGKSWMALGIALAAADGGRALGMIQVDRRPVLYLALEDGPRRLKSRMEKLGVTTWPSTLHFMTELIAPAILTIQTFMERNAHARPLVIVDVLKKITGTYGGNDAYGHDYQQMAALKGLADAVPGSSILALHHTRKAAADDYVDSVSGSQGLAGAADTILILSRSRGTGEATLHATGRETGEGSYAVQLNEGAWSIDGSGLHQASEKAALRVITGGVGDTMGELIEIVSNHEEGIKPADVAVLMPNVPPDTVRQYLTRAHKEGRVARMKRGLYGPVTSVTSVTTEELIPSEVTHVTDVTDLQWKAASNE